MVCTDVVTSLRLDNEPETDGDTVEIVINEDESDQSSRVYRLQVLYGTNLLGADIGIFSRAPRTSDPYLVVTYCGDEVARSAVTQKSTTPLFRSLQNAKATKRSVFCVDVPNEVAFANAGRAKAPELVIQVYDHDSIGSGNFLGETRLRALDLLSAVGRRVARALKPMHGSTTGQMHHKFVGGEVHIAGHLVSGQPHLMVHVIEARDLATNHTEVATLSTKALIRGMRSMTKEKDFVAMSSFVICYWNGKEVGRTDVQRRKECPQWGNDTENVFEVNLNLQNESNQRVSREQYCPELRFEVYDTVLC